MKDLRKRDDAGTWEGRREGGDKTYVVTPYPALPQKWQYCRLPILRVFAAEKYIGCGSWGLPGRDES